MFDAMSFIRTKGRETKTTVKAWDCTVKLAGLPSAFTDEGLQELAKSQSEWIPLQTARYTTELGHSGKARTVISPEDGVLFLAGEEATQEVKPTRKSGKSSRKTQAQENGQAQAQENGQAATV